MDGTGDGAGNPLYSPEAVAVDANGNVYVADWDTDSAFEITLDGTITQIIDASGDGAGNGLGHPKGIAVDSGGNVYVTGEGRLHPMGDTPGNAFKIARGCSDDDADGICQADDNCLEVANPDQRDTDSDGYGNACDADCTDDDFVSTLDFLRMLSEWAGPGSCDFNDDGVVGTRDYIHLSRRWEMADGPSGLACAGIPPCGAP
jgi:DNA-binding beta-propeller fold protein YncE